MPPHRVVLQVSMFVSLAVALMCAAAAAHAEPGRPAGVERTVRI